MLVIVIPQRHALKVIVDLDAQVVRDPLANALGVVVVDVGRDRANKCDHDDAERGNSGKAHLALPERQVVNPAQPFRQRMRPQNVVDDDFQRPRAGHAHRGLDQHCDEHDAEPAVIRANEVEHELAHRAAPNRVGVGISGCRVRRSVLRVDDR